MFGSVCDITAVPKCRLPFLPAKAIGFFHFCSITAIKRRIEIFEEKKNQTLKEIKFKFKFIAHCYRKLDIRHYTIITEKKYNIHLEN